jgi:hypothetical protein
MTVFPERAIGALIEMLREERVVTCFVRLHPLLPVDLAYEWLTQLTLTEADPAVRYFPAYRNSHSMSRSRG